MKRPFHTAITMVCFSHSLQQGAMGPADSSEITQDLQTSLVATFRMFNAKIVPTKIVWILIGGGEVSETLTVEGERIARVQLVTYLGSVLNADGNLQAQCVQMPTCQTANQKVRGPQTIKSGLHRGIFQAYATIWVCDSSAKCYWWPKTIRCTEYRQTNDVGLLVPERKNWPWIKRCYFNNQHCDTITIEAPKPLDVSM